jgi:hypothetical protein
LALSDSTNDLYIIGENGDVIDLGPGFTDTGDVNVEGRNYASTLSLILEAAARCEEAHSTISCSAAPTSKCSEVGWVTTASAAAAMTISTVG